MAQPVFPPAVVELLQEYRLQGGPVLLACPTTLDLAGRPGQQWLLATASELLVVDAKERPLLLMSIQLAETKAIRVQGAIGSAFVQVHHDGVWVDLVRLPNRLVEPFRRFVSSATKLLRSETTGLAHQEVPEPTPVKPRSTTRWTAEKLSNLLWPYRWRALLMIVLSLLVVAVEMVPPILQQKLTDNVLIHGQAAPAERPDPEQLLFLLQMIVLSLAGVQLTSAILSVFNGRLSSAVGTALTADLRTKLVAKLHTLSVSYHDRQQVGMLMSRVAYDTEAFHTLLWQMTHGFLLQGLKLVGIGVMLFTYDARLAAFTLLPMPFVAFGSYFFSKYLYPRHHRYWDSVGRQAAALSSMLSGIRVVKAFTQERREYERFRASSDHLRQSRMAVDISNATFSALMAYTFGLGGLLVWYVGGQDVLAGRMTFGELVAFFAYLGMFYAPLTQLTEITSWLSNFAAALHRIYDVLDTPVAISEPTDPLPMTNCQGAVEFEQVCFEYTNSHPVLKNVSFEIKPGEMVGIVGRSGSGKSTLVNLISRFYDPIQGTVRIDGVDVRQIASRDLRRNVGMVLQEPFLFEGSVQDNIVYGNPEASPEQLLRSAKAANAHEFILRLPFGYDTVLGERGAGLSGGEKQRVSIARALLYDPKILILDEATSSVDTESEHAIQEAIQRATRHRTTIAIAHRLSTLRNADRIFVFDQGRLIEQGTPAELLSANGLYASLVRIQQSLSQFERQLALHGSTGEEWKEQLGLDDRYEWLHTEPGDGEVSDGPLAEVRWLTPAETTITRLPKGAIQLSIQSSTSNGRSENTEPEFYRGVFAIRAFPAQRHDEYISLQHTDASDRVYEIGMIQRLQDWPEEVRQLINDSLRRRYLLHTIRSLRSIRTEGGLIKCSVATEEGGAEFFMPIDRNGLMRFGTKGRILRDIDDNHYLIPDLERLPASQQRALRLHFAD